jgi:hypothetical protein
VSGVPMNLPVFALMTRIAIPFFVREATSQHTVSFEPAGQLFANVTFSSN